MEIWNTERTGKSMNGAAEGKMVQGREDCLLTTFKYSSQCCPSQKTQLETKNSADRDAQDRFNVG